MTSKNIGFLVLAVLALSVGFVAPAHAQQSGLRDINGKAGKAWLHKSTGIAFPATLAGVDRTRIVDTTQDEWDVFSNYHSLDGNLFISLYVYETQLPEARISFDRAAKAISSRPANALESFGEIKPLSAPVVFAPAQGEAKSGVRQSFTLEGAQMRSTALAIFPYGGNWLIKVRISSRTNSGAETDALMTRVLTEWQPPKDKVKQREATEIAPCAKPLGVLPRSENVTFKTTQDLMNVALSEAGSNVARTSYLRPSYCLAEKTAEEPDVYQKLDDAGGYVIPISDNGTFIAAKPDLLGSLLAYDPADPTSMDKKRADPDFIVTWSAPGLVLVSFPQTTLPPPEQALEITIRGDIVVSSKRTHDDKETININPKFIDAADKKRFGIR